VKIHKFMSKLYRMQKYRNFLLNNLESVSHSKYNSINKERYFQPTSTTIFDELRPSNVEVNNTSNFTPYYVHQHGVLLASEDFYHLSSLYKKFEKRWLKEFADKNLLL